MSSKPPGVWGSRDAALVALGLNAVYLGVLTVDVALIDAVDPSTGEALAEASRVLAAFSMPLLLVGALGFLPWLRATFDHALATAPTPELRRFAASLGPVGCFFVPVLNLIRPYQVVRALNDALDPDEVPPPAPKMAETPATYREPSPPVIPERRRVKDAPVGLWWMLWVGRLFMNIVLRASGDSNAVIALNNLVNCAAAIAACVVVWRTAARLDELSRRRALLD